MMKLFWSIAILCVATAWVGTAAAEPETPVGQVVRVIGKPYLFRATSKAKKTSKDLQQVYKGNFKKRKDWDVYYLKRGTQIYEADVIVTRKTHKAHLLLSDRSMVTVDENSKLRIQRPKDDTINIVNIIKGKFRALISPTRTTRKPIYRSRSAVMGIRGTDFVASYEGSQTQVWTISGQVSLRARGSDPSTAVIIGPGQTAQLDDLPPRNTLRKKKQELDDSGWKEYLSQYQPTLAKDVPPKRLDKVRAFTGPLYQGNKDMMNMIAEAAIASAPKQEEFSAELASELDDDGTESSTDPVEDSAPNLAAESERQPADTAKTVEQDPEYGDSMALDGAAVFLAAIPGCGLGHALQGRWAESGWKFTGMDLLATVVGSAVLGDKNSTDVTKGLVVATILGIKGWQVYDVYSHSSLGEASAARHPRGMSLALAPVFNRKGAGALLSMDYRFGD